MRPYHREALLLEGPRETLPGLDKIRGAAPVGWIDMINPRPAGGGRNGPPPLRFLA